MVGERRAEEQDAIVGPVCREGSVPGSAKKLLKRNGTETPHLEITAVNTQATALAEPGEARG